MIFIKNRPSQTRTLSLVFIPFAARGTCSVQIARLLRTSSVRFAAFYTVVFCTSVALLLGFIYDSTVRAIDIEIDTALDTELASLVEVRTRLGQNALIKVVKERSTDPATADNAYLLVDAALQPLAGNLSQWPETIARRPGSLQFEIEQQQDGSPLSRLYRAHTIMLPDSGRLLVAHSVHRRVRIQQIVSRALGWGLAGTLALGVIGGVLTGRTMLRRIRAITDTSARIMEGNLTNRIPVRGVSDELDRLANQLNDMLDRIERLVDGLRTVSDNVAHELRAPLSRLRGAIDSALMAPPDMALYREALEQALSETDRVLNVFNAVMSITQARSDALRGQMTPLDLVETVAEAVELYEPTIEIHGLKLDLALLGEPVPILGHRQLLAQAFVNLLDNAIKFTPPGGMVRVSVARQGINAVACVSDTGPGVPLESRDRVLAPFTRGADSKDVPGTGLGLSLVAAVASLHRATLTLEDNAPGLRVTLSIPLAPPPLGPRAQ